MGEAVTKISPSIIICGVVLVADKTGVSLVAPDGLGSCSRSIFLSGRIRNVDEIEGPFSGMGFLTCKQKEDL